MYSEVSTVKKIFTLVIILLIFSFPAVASENTTTEIYNRGEKIEFPHDPIEYSNDLFIHTDDLSYLGLNVTKNDETDYYEITSQDYYGEKTKLTLKKVKLPSYDDVVINPLPPGSIIAPVTPEDIDNYQKLESEEYDFVLSSEVSGNEIKDLNCKITITHRCSSVTIGKSSNSYTVSIPDIYDENSVGMMGDNGLMIEYNEEHYVSLKLLSGTFLCYSSKNRRDFYISDTDSVVADIYVSVNKGIILPENGIKAEISIAKKTGEGFSCEDFEKISTEILCIEEIEKYYRCIMEIYPEQSDSFNPYLIVEMGDRYPFLYREMDFSKEGSIYIYPNHHNIEYSALISLPEPAMENTDFTVTVMSENKYYSATGTVNLGEQSAKIKISNLPYCKITSSYIDFKSPAYKDEYIYLRDDYVSIAYTVFDHYEEYTAKIKKPFPLRIYDNEKENRLTIENISNQKTKSFYTYIAYENSRKF